ncbi:MAG: PD-(D/E)XK nuclease family protein [Synechococcaceae cyanobacterium RL_1_2]|nr:PD-(D/E)XK nuclease family protein [Synechococcaceae cyanobacterium RL_1_2]
MNSSPPYLRLAQSHLQVLSLCPPKFAQIYLHQLGTLNDPAWQARAEWGTNFHLLMQQQELGLPLEPLLKDDQEFKPSLQALLEEFNHSLVLSASIALPNTNVTSWWGNTY